MKNLSIRERVFRLRKGGYSYNLISAQTGISKSTLSDWLSEVNYSPNAEVIARIGRARTAAIRARQRLKQQSIDMARRAACSDIGVISKRDLFMLGLGIYIGEGSKSAGIIRIVNSNPRIIRLALKWFKEVFGLRSENFRVRIHLYPDNDIDKTLRFWSRELKIPLLQFQKTQVDNRVGKKMFKRGKLAYGTAHVTVQGLGRPEHGVFLNRRILACIDKVMT